MNDSNALVLGGGGITGVAWEIGVLLGLQERGVDLTKAELMIGTSAGSVVSAQIASGVTLSDLYARQIEAVKDEPFVSLRKATLLKYAWHMWRATHADDLGHRMGQLSLNAKTESEAERRKVFEAMLGKNPPWPEKPLLITTINSKTGALRVFDKNSGASLVDAVGASAAVPGVWPAVTIQGERYIDGGMRSGTHANLATGKKHVVMIAPLSFGTKSMPSPTVHAAALKASGTQVAVVTPDTISKKAIGNDVLSPKARAQSAVAGKAQAERVFAEVSTVWR